MTRSPIARMLQRLGLTRRAPGRPAARRRWLLGAAGALVGCVTPRPTATATPRPTATATPRPTATTTPRPTATPSPVPLPPMTITGEAATAQPLQPYTLTIDPAGWRGRCDVRLIDARERVVRRYAVESTGEPIHLAIDPGGALGPQRALLDIAGATVAQAELFTLDAATVIRTGRPQYDALYPTIRTLMAQCVLEYPRGDSSVRGYRSPDNPLIWLRDHVYQGRGFRYFETDVTSTLAAFAGAQRDDGSLPDFLARPEIGVLRDERKDVEADVEYLFVQGVHDAWQMTGDLALVRRHLSAMRRALHYTMSDPLRWDATLGLVIRPYTIDTWDFAYGPTTTDPVSGQPAPRHWIDDQTVWCVFHGDNTGLAWALHAMAHLEEALGDVPAADAWRGAAAAVMERLMALSWNGAFLRHQVPLTPFIPPGVDTERQLSLSNALALNRGVLPPRAGRAIVDEYYRRSVARGTDFAAWYSIDPPFPAGSFGLAGRPGERPGEYVNGGIMPLVGGELARGAFRFGAEPFGFDILHRYAFLLDSTGASYLWYYPAGNPGISGEHTLATDGWGGSAMLAALIEGAAGVEDLACCFGEVELSPRWVAGDAVEQADVVVRYAASDGYVAYRWRLSPGAIELTVTGNFRRARVRILLPVGVRALSAATIDGIPARVTLDEQFGSWYAVVMAVATAVIVVRWA
ncbi:MAG: hypothetical protein KGS47_05235 [Chloroflexi bacterium]|nr:hypothetical protein [Chloroflexota bacterium]